MASFSIAGSREAPGASDLLIGNPSGHRSTPLSAGRLRMPPASDFMVHRARAVGKCQKQVPYSCAIGIIQPDGTGDVSPTGPAHRKEATSVPEMRSPTVRRRELGALLRKLRNERGLTVEQVAERLL